MKIFILTETNQHNNRWLVFKDSNLSGEHVDINDCFSEAEITDFQSKKLTVCRWNRQVYLWLLLWYSVFWFRAICGKRRSSPEKNMFNDQWTNQRAPFVWQLLSLTWSVSAPPIYFVAKVQKSQAYRVIRHFCCFFSRSMGRLWALTWIGFWNQWTTIWNAEYVLAF